MSGRIIPPLSGKVHQLTATIFSGADGRLDPENRTHSFLFHIHRGWPITDNDPPDYLLVTQGLTEKGGTHIQELTVTGEILGSPDRIPPEVVRARPLCDIPIHAQEEKAK